ncbi:hypothetical protein [Escherichia coli]|uniref:hypothetical protein n=1 Tax=Escherichia coli TaxID=562 RepID=UPI000854A3D1|nr:hypothetical protein [Escherichia coli]EEX9039437.1 hypothetical protein [Escherichia coli]EFJ8039244.1 hypothetical protein [Escherichia coli]EJS2621873.1 hypothetical protein [Escherichia coli]EKE5038041.1 hypothetical protein [Escherichia coli]MBB9971738.1 hypothetical protein [Escherichia coli]
MTEDDVTPEAQLRFDMMVEQVSVSVSLTEPFRAQHRQRHPKMLSTTDAKSTNSAKVAAASLTDSENAAAAVKNQKAT